MSFIKKVIERPDKVVPVIREKLIHRYVNAANAIDRRKKPAIPSSLAALQEILNFASTETDISDHLPVMFVEGLRFRPKLIVELGVRRGASTFVWERVARLFESDIVSVDIDPCLDASEYDRWRFVQEDDISFANRFEQWCADEGLPSNIDVLFIDTSHEYEHTVAEIRSWFPHLSDQCIVFFHDTNMQEVYHRNSGSRGHGWDNDRGVIRAIEEFLGVEIDETIQQSTIVGQWIVRHYPTCSGLTILEKLEIDIS